MEDHWDRCCNPLNHNNHRKSAGLRRASKHLCIKWSLTDKHLLCPTCRVTLTNTEPTTTHQIDNNDVLEIRSSSSQQSTSETSTFASEILSQQLSSQLSIDARLPVINDALQLLEESPIPKKKLKTETWVRNKVEQVSSTLKRSLGVPNLETSSEIESRDLHDIIDRLKGKLHLDETSKAEKIQILTVLPLYWSTEKLSEVMDVSRTMANAAKELGNMKGILSMPDARRGLKENDKLWI